MIAEHRPCPICHNRIINLGHENDEVEFTCGGCGGQFTAGEARRGQLYVAADAAKRRIDELEARIVAIERAIGFRRS